MHIPAPPAKTSSRSIAGTLPASSAARSFPAPQADAVAQLVLNRNILLAAPQAVGIPAILTLATTYNTNLKKKKRGTRLNQLSAVERAVYTWFETNKQADLNENPAAVWMKQLMNEVQREHTAIVTASVNAGDANPPIANFSTLTPTQQQLARTLWTRIVNGTGNIQITETENYNDALNQPQQHVHAGFRFEALAQFARLLETETGREIVAKVDRNTGGAKPVTIQPGMAAATGGRPESEFAAAPVAQDNRDQMTKVPNIDAMFAGQQNAVALRKAYKKRFVPIRLRGLPGERAKLIYDARRSKPNSIGVVIAGQYYLYGAGTGANVTMTRDIPDSANHSSSRMVDAQGNELVFPNFITLGHELGHAGHMIDGTALADNQVTGDLHTRIDANAGGDWTHTEELGTITGSENKLRAEYGMSARYGHINQPFFQRRLLNNIVNALFILVPRLPNAQQLLINPPLNAANGNLALYQLPQARQGIAAVMLAVVNNLAAAFPNFTQPQRNAISTPLQQAGPRVANANVAGLRTAAQEVATADAAIVTAQNAPPPVPQPNFAVRGLRYARSWLPF